MLCRVFTTAQYFYRGDVHPDGATVGKPVIFDEANLYHGELVPNQESILDIFGMWESGGQVHLLVTLDITWYPGWRLAVISFDASDGSFVRISDGIYPSGILYWLRATVAENGAVWVHLSTGGMVRMRFVPGSDPVEEESIDETFFGLSNIQYAGVATGYLLLGGGEATGSQSIDVYDRSDGSLVRTIHVPDKAIAFAHGERTQWYALLENGALVSFDHSTGEVFQYTQLQLGVDLAGEAVYIAWSKRFRRLLVVVRTDDIPYESYGYGPGESGGVCTTRVKGYRNRPVATHVCKPVPLGRLREGEPQRFLSRIIGDAGEPIPGRIDVSDATGVTVARASAIVDGDGDGLIDVMCDAEGSGDIEVSIAVECTIDDPAIENPLNENTLTLVG